jgi:hypothetical protein
VRNKVTGLKPWIKIPGCFMRVVSVPSPLLDICFSFVYDEENLGKNKLTYKKEKKKKY